MYPIFYTMKTRLKPFWYRNIIWKEYLPLITYTKGINDLNSGLISYIVFKF